MRTAKLKLSKNLKIFIALLIIALVIVVVVLREEAAQFFGVLPEGAFMANPMEKAPDLNPVAGANPFEGMWENPFK